MTATDTQPATLAAALVAALVAALSPPAAAQPGRPWHPSSPAPPTHQTGRCSDDRAT